MDRDFNVAINILGLGMQYRKGDRNPAPQGRERSLAH
jgi:hypothetical protein